MKQSKYFSRVVAQIKKHQDIIATHRNALRDIHRQLDDVLSTLDNGDELLGVATRYLESAIDKLSEQL